MLDRRDRAETGDCGDGRGLRPEGAGQLTKGTSAEPWRACRWSCWGVRARPLSKTGYTIAD